MVRPTAIATVLFAFFIVGRWTAPTLPAIEHYGTIKCDGEGEVIEGLDFTHVTPNHEQTMKIPKRTDHKPYVTIMIDGKAYQAHRVAWLYMTGRWPKDQIDHIDGDGANNRWTNLREATPSQNAFNTRPKKSRGLPKGVVNNKGKFEAQITVNGIRLYLGRYQTIDEADAAYREAAIHHAAEFARFE